jgi:toxin ParE1/3/4
LNIEWTERARRDLLNIFEYILNENPTAAAETLDRIDGAVSQLADHPGLGRPGRVPRTRELIIGRLPYIVPYTIAADRVTILRVLHAARKWPEGF